MKMIMVNMPLLEKVTNVHEVFGGDAKQGHIQFNCPVKPEGRTVQTLEMVSERFCSVCIALKIETLFLCCKDSVSRIWHRLA